MKLAAVALACASMVTEISTFLVESDGLQSWGEQELPSQWERADAAASEMAAWMPKSNKRRRVDIEFEHRHIRGHRARSPASSGSKKANIVPVAKWFEEAHVPLPREIQSAQEAAPPKQRHQQPTDLPEDEEPAPTVQPPNLVKAVLKPRFSPEQFARGGEKSESAPAEGSSSSIFERSLQETTAWAARPSSLSHHVADLPVKTSNEIPLDVANSAGGDEGPELAHKTRTVVAAGELKRALKKLKAEIPLHVSSNATGDEGPEVGQTIRRVAVANVTGYTHKLTKAHSNVSEIPFHVSSNATGVEGPEAGQTVRRVTAANVTTHVQNLTKAPSNASKLAAVTTTAPSSLPTSTAAVTESNQLVHRNEVAVPALNGSLSPVLTCVCGGVFKEGERVKYTGHAFPPGRTFGVILGGTNNGFLNVEWDNFSTGHSGNCKLTTCGSCIESTVKSRWFTSCKDLAAEKPAALSTTTTTSTTTTPPLLSVSSAPLKQSPSNQLVHHREVSVSEESGSSSGGLACVCAGRFKEGERVKYTGHAFPSGRTFGTILGGTRNGFLNVEWDNFSTGHDGNCKLTTCGSCIESLVKSRWFTACKDLAIADAKPENVNQTSL